MAEAEATPELSLVVPFFNEEAAVARVVGEIGREMTALGRPWEAILVDDGSADRTPEGLEEAARPWTRCRVLRLGGHQGQGGALLRGIREARAPVVAMMDGDGQNMPADIGVLLPLLDRADLVVGVRTGRRDPPLRLALSRLANAVRGRMLHDGASDAGCALKVFRREVADSFRPMPMLNPFMPAFAAAAGFRVAEHPVRHRARFGGRSKYGLRAMLWRPMTSLLAVWWLLKARGGTGRPPP